MSRRRRNVSADNVRVAARFRPMNPTEELENSHNIARVSEDHTCVEVELGQKNHEFAFDHVFDAESTQLEVYERVGKPIVDLVFNGYNGTIFCYGQTGAGKTWTMMGPCDDDEEDKPSRSGYCDDPVLKGLIPRVIERIFALVEESDANLEFTIQIQFVEIYMEKLRDLLNSRSGNLAIREDRATGRGIFVEGATRVYCSSVEEVFRYMARGYKLRVVASHRMNKYSSRSHSVFVVVLNQKNLSNGEQRSGQLFLVDLAGSEKVNKTHASGHDLDVARFINLSLTTLGRVIMALTGRDKNAYVPYRDSVLTRLLQDSLGGNSKTALVVNCSPASYNFEETLSTLRFGKRAKTIKNRARINRELDAKKLRYLLNQAKETIRKQRDYIHVIEGKLDALKGSLSDSRDGKQEDESEGDDAVSRRSPLDDLLDMRKKNDDLEVLLNEKIEKIAELEQQKSNLRVDLVGARAEIQLRMKDLAKFEAELESKSQLSVQNERLENELTLLKVQLGKVERERDEHGITIVNLQKRVEKAECDPRRHRVDAVLENFMNQYSAPLEGLQAVTEAPKRVTNAIGDSEPEEIHGAMFACKQPRRDRERRSRMKFVHPLEDFTSETDKCSDDSSPSSFVVSEGDPGVKKSLEQPVNDRVFSDLGADATEEDSLELRVAACRETRNESGQMIAPEAAMKLESENARLHRIVGRLREMIRVLESNHKKIEIHLSSQKVALMRDLRNRCDKVVELEMVIDEKNDKLQHMKFLARRRPSSRRILELEKSVRDLTQQLQKYKRETHTLTLKIQMLEKRLKIRIERIFNLEKSLEDVISKNNFAVEKSIKRRAKLLMDNDKLYRELTYLKGVVEQIQDYGHLRAGSRVVVPLRGGGKSASCAVLDLASVRKRKSKGGSITPVDQNIRRERVRRICERRLQRRPVSVHGRAAEKFLGSPNAGLGKRSESDVGREGRAKNTNTPHVPVGVGSQATGQASVHAPWTSRRLKSISEVVCSENGNSDQWNHVMFQKSKNPCRK